MNYEESFKQLELDKEILKKCTNSKEYRNYVNSFLTVELLTELVNKYSLNHICKEIFLKKGYNISPSSLKDRCKKFKIKTFSIKEIANKKETRDKYIKTCTLKYGTKNSLSKDTIFYKKRNKTVKERYSVNNVFQIKEIIEKSKSTMLQKYGVTCSSQLPWYERNFGRTSKVHLKIEEYLKKINVEFESEKLGFLKFNKKLNRIFSPKVDILLKNKKFIIEVYGDYWHGNPKKYDKDYIISRWDGKKKASEIWNYDKIRVSHLKSFGYKVIILWESDINKNFKKVEKIISKILN
jgi:very-short-patch-repair endonuclease